MKIFIDTGAFIAVIDKDDDYHGAAGAFFKNALEKEIEFIKLIILEVSGSYRPGRLFLHPHILPTSLFKSPPLYFLLQLPDPNCLFSAASAPLRWVKIIFSMSSMSLW